MKRLLLPAAAALLAVALPVAAQQQGVTADTVSAAFDSGTPIVTPVNGDTVPWVNTLSNETDRAHAVVHAEHRVDTAGGVHAVRAIARLGVDADARVHAGRAEGRALAVHAGARLGRPIADAVGLAAGASTDVRITLADVRV